MGRGWLPSVPPHHVSHHKRVAESDPPEPQVQTLLPTLMLLPGAWVPEHQFYHLYNKFWVHRGWNLFSGSHLLLQATRILHPFIWLSSLSEISTCRGSQGAQTVTSTWEVKRWWVKSTIASTPLSVSLSFTETESVVGKHGGGGDLEMRQQKKAKRKNEKRPQTKIHNNDTSGNSNSPDLLESWENMLVANMIFLVTNDDK